MNEANILKTLDHPGVINYYDNFQEGKTHHLVLEYALHGDFQSFMKQNALTQEAKLHYIA